MTLRAVTFDFWGTLFQWNDGNAELRRAAVREFVGRHRAELSGEVVDAAFAAGVRAQDRAWRAEARHFGPDSILEHLLAELRLEVPAEERAPLLAVIEDPAPDRRLEPVPGAAAAAARLRARGLRLGIVCDAGMMVGRVLRRHLEQSGMAAHFEPAALAFSDEVGVTKPRPEIFRRALAALGADPSEAAHIGDLRFTDVAGARALGMRTVRFRGFNDDSGEGPEADAVIDDYAGLEQALGLPPA